MWFVWLSHTHKGKKQHDSTCAHLVYNRKCPQNNSKTTTKEGHAAKNISANDTNTATVSGKRSSATGRHRFAMVNNNSNTHTGEWRQQQQHVSRTTKLNTQKQTFTEIRKSEHIH